MYVGVFCTCTATGQELEMGNQRNKTNKFYNTHRHLFKRRRAPNANKKSSEVKKGNEMKGSRIMNVKKLREYTEQVSAHSSKCTGSMVLQEESRDGFASIFKAHCNKCEKIITLSTSEKVKGQHGYSRWESNLAAVWGQMSTGQGHSQLQKSMSIFRCSHHVKGKLYSH